MTSAELSLKAGSRQLESGILVDGRRGIRSRARRWMATRLATDVAMLALAAGAARLGSGAAVTSAPVGWVILFTVLTLVFLRMRGMYGGRLRVQLLDDLRDVVIGTSLAAMTVLTARELLVGYAGAADEAVRAWAFATVYLAAGRYVLARWQQQARLAGACLRPTLIVGAGRIARLTAARLQDIPELGLRPIGYLDKEPLAEDEAGDDLPVLGASWDLERIVAEHKVEHVVIGFSTAPHEVLLRLMARCETMGLSVSFVPRLFEKVTDRLAVEHVGGLPLITVRPANPKGWQFALKYTLDRIGAAILLVVLLPLLLVTTLAIWRTMGTPILFRQLRVGRDGRSFSMLKFRSMTLADENGVQHVTRVGALLRRFSLDELPQLFNVLTGEMSLVGPRPERPEYVSEFEVGIYRYSDRHRVKSGITGWAQVHGIGRGWDRFDGHLLAARVEWDNYYIENWSPWLDLKILILTVRAVLRFGQLNDSSSAPALPPPA